MVNAKKKHILLTWRICKILVKSMKTTPLYTTWCISMFVDFIRLSCLTKVIYSSNWQCVVKLENPPQKRSCWKPMDSCLWCLPCFGQHTHMLIVFVVVSVLPLPYTWVKNTLPWLIWPKKKSLENYETGRAAESDSYKHTCQRSYTAYQHEYVYVYIYIYIIHVYTFWLPPETNSWNLKMMDL